MQKGDRVRFRVAYYNSDLQITKDTDEIAEGVIVHVSKDALIVKVDDKETAPFYVTPDRIVEG